MRRPKRRESGPTRPYRWCTMGLVVILIGTGFAAARSQLLEDYRFKGRILDTAGQPVADVHITFRDVETGAHLVCQSQKDGTFDRRMIPHGVYDVTFEKDGYVSQTVHFDWSASPSGTVTKEVQIVLEGETAKARRELGTKSAALYDEAYDALTRGDCPTASQKAEELLKLGVGEWEYAVRFVLARCHAARDEFEPAVREYREVLTLRPDLFEAHFDLATVLEQMGSHAEALEEFGLAAELHPDDIEVQYNMGAILVRAQEFDQARPHLEMVVRSDSTHAQALKALGFVYLQGEKKDLKAAAEMLKTYLRLAPEAPDADSIREIVSAIAPPSKDQE